LALARENATVQRRLLLAGIDRVEARIPQPCQLFLDRLPNLSGE
jgi:hypothetical protein